MGKECGWREAIALIRLHILTEGQTEEAFVKGVLGPALSENDIFADAHSITTGRRHGRPFRGGMIDYDHLARDLMLWMKQDQRDDSWFTTMIDFHGLPRNFPGRAAPSASQVGLHAVLHLEAELGRDIAHRLGGAPVSERLVPYIQLHEFEALLFSDPAAFREVFLDRPKALAALADIRANFPNPEDIDGGPLTAPSKRIRAILPDYQKPVAGILIARRIGLAVLRRECPHFNEWVERLLAARGWHAPPAPG